ncbi:hypothetical protein N5P32_12890 [Marinomonas pontica]|nr:hypothetical protein [Marinomonas pontica]MCW8356741.1 hypothetical protein [Marinomonas pontica]
MTRFNQAIPLFPRLDGFTQMIASQILLDFNTEGIRDGGGVCFAK